MQHNTQILDNFFESDMWSSLCHQAIEENNPDAKELMKILSVCIDSLYFFLEKDEHHRAKRELENITKIINLVHEL